jgi:hypothetical protein
MLAFIFDELFNRTEGDKVGSLTKPVYYTVLFTSAFIIGVIISRLLMVGNLFFGP